MLFQVNLNDDQFMILQNLSKLMAKNIEDLLMDYIQLLTVQATPIYHLTNLIESSRYVLPSFEKAIDASKDPSINMGDVVALLLREIFNGPEIEENIAQIKKYFSDVVGEKESEEKPSEPHRDVTDKKEVTDIIKDILNNKNENGKT